MLDFIFRRGNPTNGWSRASNLALSTALDEPSFNGVALGARFDRLSSLGRSDTGASETLCYFDLGVTLDCSTDDTLSGFSIFVMDEDNQFQPYRGMLSWMGNQLDASGLLRADLTGIFGDWYWLDEDEDESIAFFEYPKYELQIELTPTGAIKTFILTNEPLMADREYRDAYKVDKPWPPR